jgi:hypothetical protein
VGFKIKLEQLEGAHIVAVERMSRHSRVMKMYCCSASPEALAPFTTSLLSDRRFERVVSCPVGVVGLSVTPPTVRRPII